MVVSVLVLRRLPRALIKCGLILILRFCWRDFKIFLLPNLEKVSLRFLLILVKELVGEIIKVGRKNNNKKVLTFGGSILKSCLIKNRIMIKKKFHPNFKNKGPIF